MTKWRIGAVSVAVVIVALIAFVSFDSASAGLRTGPGWTNFPGKVQFGDNASSDTIDVAGFMEIDSLATLNNMTIAYFTLTDSGFVSSGKLFFGTGSMLRADSVHFNDNVFFGKGKTVYGDSTLIFDNCIVTFNDSVRVGGTAFFDGEITATAAFTMDGGIFTADSANIDSADIGSHLTAAAITASGTVTANGDLTVDGGILTADSANIDSIDVGSHATVAALTASGAVSADGGLAVSGGALTADTASIDTLIVSSWATVEYLTMNGNITMSGGKIVADSANIDSMDVGSHLTAAAVTATGTVTGAALSTAGRVTGARAEMDTLSVGSEEALIPMVFQAESLGVAQTIAVWKWPRAYEVAEVSVASLTAPDDTVYLEVLLDTLGGTHRDTILIGGTGKAGGAVYADWLEADTEGCTLSTFLGSGTKGGLKANIILWLKLR